MKLQPSTLLVVINLDGGPEPDFNEKKYETFKWKEIFSLSFSHHISSGTNKKDLEGKLCILKKSKINLMKDF